MLLVISFIFFLIGGIFFYFYCTKDYSPRQKDGMEYMIATFFVCSVISVSISYVHYQDVLTRWEEKMYYQRGYNACKSTFIILKPPYFKEDYNKAWQDGYDQRLKELEDQQKVSGENKVLSNSELLDYLGIK